MTLQRELSPGFFRPGILAILVYLVSTFLAILQYPKHYSPMENWLSDLGNINLNPKGAIVYNIGVISTAIFLLLFFWGVSRWKMENKKVQNLMVNLTQVFGISGSICLAMSAIFPINLSEIHRIWSIALYSLLATGFVFSAVALGYHPMVPRWNLVFGLMTAGMADLMSILPAVYVLEWITVIYYLSYIGLISVKTAWIKPGGVKT